MAYDEGEHIKEVFAYFGRAYYEAGVLETGLAIALMQSAFLSRVRDQYLTDREELWWKMGDDGLRMAAYRGG